MDKTKENHSRWLHIRLKEEEHNRIYNKYKVSTCRKLSEYARCVLLHKPVTIHQRNQSLDDFMGEMIRLRYDLNSVADKLNEAAQQLNTLQKISEFKSWLILHETTRKALLEKVEIIKQKINSINDQWLQ